LLNKGKGNGDSERLGRSKPGNVALAAGKVPQTFPCRSGTFLHPKTDEWHEGFGHNADVLDHTTPGTSSTSSTWQNSHGSLHNNSKFNDQLLNAFDGRLENLLQMPLIDLGVWPTSSRPTVGLFSLPNTMAYQEVSSGESSGCLGYVHPLSSTLVREVLSTGENAQTLILLHHPRGSAGLCCFETCYFMLFH